MPTSQVDDQITSQRHTIRVLKYRAKRQLKTCNYKIKIQVSQLWVFFSSIILHSWFCFVFESLKTSQSLSLPFGGLIPFFRRIKDANFSCIVVNIWQISVAARAVLHYSCYSYQDILRYQRLSTLETHPSSPLKSDFIKQPDTSPLLQLHRPLNFKLYRYFSVQSGDGDKEMGDSVSSELVRNALWTQRSSCW